MRSQSRFAFHDPGTLLDDDLQLVLTDRFPGDPVRDYVPAYRFMMRMTASREYAGYIELRVGNTPDILLYAGHVGYRVEPPFRGRHYAARSCLLILPLATLHGLDPLWITCNPDNVASRKTLEHVGAQFVEIVSIPREHEMYRNGERAKCRYRLDLNNKERQE